LKKNDKCSGTGGESRAKIKFAQKEKGPWSDQYGVELGGTAFAG